MFCSEIGGKYGWGFVNIDLRPYYSEGSKSYAFEIAEQLGWRTPDHVVAPMAGGSLVTKIRKAFLELDKLGLTDGASQTRVHGAQAAGCAPIVDALRAGRDAISPVRQPSTIAKSLAIGDPADGAYAIRAIRESGGHGATATDPDLPANTLRFSLDPETGAPGATIDETSGEFRWPVPAGQAPGEYTIRIIVADNADPALADSESFVVTVT